MDSRAARRFHDANMALAKVQACLELGDLDCIDETDRAVVTGYNRDDCISTWRLRDWLESQRAELIEAGTAVPRPEAPEGAPSEGLGDWQEKIDGLIEKLTSDVPADVAERTAEQHARWLLAHTLDWHRREQKALWWEYFRLSDLTAEDLLDERAGLAGLTFVSVTAAPRRRRSTATASRPRKPKCEAVKICATLAAQKFGKVDAISLDERWVDIKKRGDSADIHPEAVFSHTVIGTEVLANALVRIGEYVADHGMEGDGPFQAARDLLMRWHPRLGGQPIQNDGEAGARCGSAGRAGNRKRRCSPSRGRLGAGKTHTGARMICALVQAGKTVGVTANSHKVIRNLLDDGHEGGRRNGLRCALHPEAVGESSLISRGLRFVDRQC